MDRTEVLYKLKKHLQLAIELEHATLPPYLCAYWSIFGESKEAKEAKHLILSVVQEEMLHLAMACNILNATGGSPILNGKEFIPNYPCHLPGHSLTQNPFLVHLDRCCPQSIGTFLEIELPAKKVHHKSNDGWATIGKFYEEIIELISSPLLTDDDFRHGKQMDNSANPAKGKLYTVYSKADALAAINEIIDQGEGHVHKSHHDADNELTHYWKFKKVLKSMENGKWDYENEVYPMSANPDIKFFPEEVLMISEDFNKAYSRLLDSMQVAFNNENPNLNEAIKIMFELEPLAKKLMQTKLFEIAGNVGPTFEYKHKENRSF